MAVFDRSEYLRRIERAKTRMASRDLDLLLVTTPENINYLSGYAGWSFYTSQALILTPGMEQPVLIVRDMDTACADHTAFLDRSNVVGYPELYIGGDKQPMSFIAEVIQQRCGRIRRIGFEPDSCFFSVKAAQVLCAALRGVEVVDSEGLINWLRTVKSTAELDVIREAAALAGMAMATAHEHIRPGVRECDVAAEIYRTMIRGNLRAGGSMPASFALASGARTSAPHIEWTDAQIEDNQAVTLELGGSRHHYHAGLSRTWWLGEPADELRRLSNAVIDGVAAALGAVQPGALCEDVESAWRAVIARAGYEKKSRIGYSIGLCFSPSWIDGTASLQAGDRTLLEPGMTFHLICGMWKDAHKFLLSETFAVTSVGHEVLTSFPRELLVKS